MHSIVSDNLFTSNKMILWKAISHKPLNMNEKVVNVFLGGQDGVQVTPFKTAWQNLHITNNWTVQYISVGYINELHWSPKDLVDWLLSAHIHIILSHVHQGVANFLKWNMLELQVELQRLKFHVGFPNLSKLQCPVFLQDKYKYLQCMPVHKVNNTLQLYLTDDTTFYTLSNVSVMDQISRLMILFIYH
jgi:hypothetical protein